MHVTNLTEKQRALVVKWDDGAQSEFHYIWLRDNCRCEMCRSAQTFERISYTGDIPLDIKPLTTCLSSDGGLDIVWVHDEMRSHYGGEWLYAHRYQPGAPAVSAVDPQPAKTPWDASLNGQIPTFTYRELMGSDDRLLEWIESVVQYGLVITRGVPIAPRPDLDPPQERSPVRLALRAACGEVERFANHVAVVREDLFDSGRADMKVDPSGYAQALTPIALPLHTDVPCFDWPPGVLMLHCLQPAIRGGESVFVDGFHIARQLREHHSDAFELLSTHPVRFKLASPEAELISRKCMLELDEQGEIRVFRLSIHEVQPLDFASNLIEPFYHAYHQLCALVNHPANQLRCKLDKGDMWTTFNHRVAHGRTGFVSDVTRPRHLQHAYINYDDMLGRARVIKRTKEGRGWPDVY